MDVRNIKNAQSEAQQKPFDSGTTFDRSRKDFALACKMIRSGYHHDEIFDALSKTEKGMERGKSYIKFTIKNAIRAVEKEQNKAI